MVHASTWTELGSHGGKTTPRICGRTVYFNHLKRYRNPGYKYKKSDFFKTGWAFLGDQGVFLLTKKYLR